MTNVEAADPDDLQAVWCCVGVAAPTTGNPAQGKVQAKMEVHQKIRNICSGLVAGGLFRDVNM